MREILAAESVVLDSTDMTQLRGLDRYLRYVSGKFMLRAEESTDYLWNIEKDNEFHFRN